MFLQSVSTLVNTSCLNSPVYVYNNTPVSTTLLIINKTTPSYSMLPVAKKKFMESQYKIVWEGGGEGANRLN